jgi:hypothetical protein
LASCRVRRRRRGTAWLKPGVSRDGFPTVMREGRYAPDGSVWEHTIYLHSLVFAVGRPAIRLDEPICGTFAFKSALAAIDHELHVEWKKECEQLEAQHQMALDAQAAENKSKKTVKKPEKPPLGASCLLVISES